MKFIRYALIILAAILIVLLIFVIIQYRSIQQTQSADARALRLSLIMNSHGPLPVGDANLVIRSWMTFDYVDKLFALPPDYLKTKLQISDAHYPRLTISGYVKAQKLDAATFLSEVDDAVRMYAGSASSTSPGTGSSTINLSV